MNLRQIDYFIQVAELGSFTRASAVLAIAQPAISRQVHALELELACSLFHRNGRGVLLTEAGNRFLAYAKGIFHQLDGARQAIHGGEANLIGKVVIGMPPSLGHMLTLPFLRIYRERFPKAELSIVEALSVPLRERLLAGRVDAIVAHNPKPSLTVNIEPALMESLCLLSGENKELGRRKTVSFQTLGRFDLIFPSAPHPIRSLVETEAARRGINLRIALEIDSINTSLQLVAEGFGHMISPYNVVRAGMSDLGVVARPIVNPDMQSMIALVTPTHRPTTLLADGAVDILRSVLKNVLKPAAIKRN